MRLSVAVAIAVTAFPLIAFAQSPSPSPSPTPSVGDEDALLREIEGVTAQPTPPLGEPRAPIPSPGMSLPGGRGSATTISNVYNPAMSVIGLFLGSATSKRTPAEGDTATGLGVQELEVQFLANVDPYFSANLLLAVPEGEGIELEEGFLSPTAQPGGLAFRIGKTKLPFGRENILHTHALPFVDRSLAGTAILGEEGIADAGVEVSWLTPLPWYSLVYVTVFDGTSEALFASGRDEDLAGFLAAKNVIDLSPDTTLELGGSIAAGNNADLALTQVAGAHAVLKWRPARRATTRSLTATAEALYSHRAMRAPAPGDPRSTNVGGAYGFVDVQLARRWHVAGRFDYLGFPVEGGVTRRGSVGLAWAPTEFSAIRAQANATQPPGGEDPVVSGFLQFVFSLGAHPAHLY